MFEKEAEERYCKGCKLRMEQCLWAWRNTNGLNEPNEKNCSCKEVPAYITGAEFGYNKANEWHYPSKGELPKCDEETQLIFYVNCYYEIGGETKIRKRTVLGFYKKSFMNDDVKLFVEKSKGYEDEHLPKDVIAWKEIVLPELPKESE